MNKAILVRWQTAISLAAGMVVCACLPVRSNSTAGSGLNGYDAEQLAQYEQANAVTLKPKYQNLSTPNGERQTVKMAIFISYDKVVAESIGYSPKGKSSVELDPWSLGDNKDYGAASFAEILRWLVDGEDSFLKGATVERGLKGPQAFSALIKGKGPALAKSAASMDWEIQMHIGVAGTAEFAKAFGEAMAVSNIAMLNGHFFQEDAAAAEASSSSTAQDRRFRDWSADDAAIDQFWTRQRSNIYQPAMEAFKAKAGEISEAQRLSYRVAVFNGCGSEKIEKLVLDTMAAVSAEAELVGMRGFSNYRHFPSQIHRFLSALVNDGKWTDVIKSFEFDDESTSEAMRHYLGASRVGNSSPVYRSATVGADGEKKSQQNLPESSQSVAP